MDNQRTVVAYLALFTSQLLLHLLDSAPQIRGPCKERTRLDWEARAAYLVSINRFERTYKMSLPSFNALLALLAPSLEVDEQQSHNRTGTLPVTPANKLQMFLRYMSGGSVHDITAYSGVAETTFYDGVEEVRAALLAHPDLQIKFPQDDEAQRQIMLGFQGLSNGGVMRGCVGAIDGWLCQTDVPSAKAVPRVRPFYSGHYRCSGVNVQACCDHKSRFTAVTVSSPGGTGDSVAYQDTGLVSMVKALAIGRYLVGDNAYANENKLLTPYPAPSIGGDVFKDSYNFHLSQLRIRIEMAFGLLVRKWRIFRTPLQVSFPNVSRTIMAACILHNWCINRRLLEDPDFDIRNDEVLVQELMDLDPGAQQPTDDSLYRQLYVSPETEARRRVIIAADRNLVRNAIVEMLRRNTITRPRRNMVRRAREEVQRQRRR